MKKILSPPNSVVYISLIVLIVVGVTLNELGIFPKGNSMPLIIPIAVYLATMFVLLRYRDRIK